MDNADYLDVGRLPDTVLEQVLSFLKYDHIAKLRRVNKRFDMICKSRLNKGFRAVEKYHARCLKDVKTKLPRRESERRDHPLARHNDILNAIETRISLLSMTFMKYVDLGLCCFIPGKVIDEIFAVLRKMNSIEKFGKPENPTRHSEILQELRDISSMAMEYFDENIVPDLKNKFPDYSPVRLANGSYSYLYSIFTSGTGFSLNMRYNDPVSPTPPQSPLNPPNPAAAAAAAAGAASGAASCPRIRSLELHPTENAEEPAAVGGSPSLAMMARSPLRTRANCVRDLTASVGRSAPIGANAPTPKRTGLKANRVLKQLKRQADAYKSAVESQNKKMLELDRRIDAQNEIINQQNARLAEQEEKLAEMSKRVTENENKFTTAAVAAVAVAGSSKASTATANNDDSIENSVVDGESISKSEAVKKSTARPNKRTRSDERHKDEELDTKRQRRSPVAS